MIVSCAYCGPLPLADLEELHDRAWGKHVAEEHPEWPVEMTVPEDARWSGPALIDGQVSGEGGGS
jgi:hypothetical protein